MADKQERDIETPEEYSEAMADELPKLADNMQAHYVDGICNCPEKVANGDARHDGGVPELMRLLKEVVKGANEAKTTEDFFDVMVMSAKAGLQAEQMSKALQKIANWLVQGVAGIVPSTDAFTDHVVQSAVRSGIPEESARNLATACRARMEAEQLGSEIGLDKLNELMAKVPPDVQVALEKAKQALADDLGVSPEDLVAIPVEPEHADKAADALGDTIKAVTNLDGELVRWEDGEPTDDVIYRPKVH